MNFNRQEAKWRAKRSMQGAYPHPVLVTLVFILLTTVLTNVVMYFVANPFQLAYLYLLDGVYEPDQIFRMIFTPARVVPYVVLTLLLDLYAWVMNFGYVSYSLRLGRYEQPSYRNLMDGFAMLGRVIGMNIMIFIFIWLWSMLGMIPYMVAVFAAVFFENLGLMFLAVLLCFAGAIFSVAMGYRYRLADYFLLDNPGEMGVLACIRASKNTMRGRKWSLFVLDLSFIGWRILCVLTLGILSLWVNPYMFVTRSYFYDWAVHGSFPEPPAPPTNNPYPGPNGGNPPTF